MPSRIFVVDDDPGILGWLRPILEREGYTVQTASRGLVALDQIAQDPPALVVLDWILPDVDGLEVLRRLRQDPHLNDLWVILLSVKDRPDDIAAGLAAGADEYVPKRAGADVELLSKIRGLLAGPKKSEIRPLIPPPQKRLGRVFSFCSAKGGTGTSSVCLNSACALAQLEPDARLLLVDMVYPIGSLGPFIGYNSTATLARMLREAKGKIEPPVVEEYLSPIQPSGLRLLVGACEPQEASLLQVTQISALFKILRTMFDYILVDFGRTLSQLALPVLQMSRGVVVVVTSDINTVKLTRITLDYIASLGIPRSKLLLLNNRTEARVWVSSKDTESELKLPVAGVIPFEGEYVTMAVNAGMPFMVKFPDHPASRVFVDVAHALLQHAGE